MQGENNRKKGDFSEKNIEKIEVVLLRIKLYEHAK